MAKELAKNVQVDGVWYGPSYPDAEVTAEIAKAISNPAAWQADQPQADAANGLVDQLDDLTVPELRKLADERGVDVPSDARKADIISLLSGG